MRDDPNVDYEPMIPAPPSWHRDAACVGSDQALWFPVRGQSVDEAKAICSTCPVRVQCLTDALDRGEMFGIWGGLSTKQRKQIRRDE